MEELVSMIVNALRNISISACIDIVVVAFIFYKGYFLIKETRAEQLLKGIALIIVLIPISYLFNLSMLYYILNKTLAIGVLSVVIIFQPEIRRALEHLGRSAFEDKHGFEDEEQMNKNVNEIVEAVINLAETKTGALIAIEQGTGLGELIASGTEIDSKISANLLENIFVVNTPLHDGATIIGKGRIIASGCVLPLTNQDINKKLGTRHRAAIGISKESDSIVVVVSEETGKISVAKDGTLIADVREDVLKKILISNIVTKRFTQKKTVKNNKFENIKKRFNKKPETETKENENK